MKFTEEQQKIVESEADQIRVIATPGSGKTTTTVGRIAYLVNTKKITPENIFVFCFAKNDKAELIKKLQRVLDYQTVSRLFVNNYHGFSINLIRQYGLYEKEGKEIKLLEENESLTFIKKELELIYSKASSSSKDVEFLFKKAKRLSVPSLIFSLFDLLRDEYVLKLSDSDKIRTPQFYKALDSVAEKIEAVNKISQSEDNDSDNEDLTTDTSSFNLITITDFISIAKKYADFCKNHGYVDFMDMILQAFYMLKSNAKLLEEVSNRIQYLHVDEFQDISNLQFELVSLITQRNNRIFAVGDISQTIFEWRNSKPYYMKDGLPKRFSNLQTYPLSLNFRSDANIVKVANNLIQYSQDRIPVDIVATFPAKEAVISRKFESIMDQANHVAEIIAQMLGSEDNYYVEKDHKIAIIVRSAKSISANLIRNALFKKRIPVQLKFESNIVKKIMQAISAISNLIIDPKAPVDLGILIGILPGFGEKTMDKVLTKLQEGKDLHTIAKELKLKGEKLDLVNKLALYLKDLNEAYENNNNIKISELNYFGHSFNLAKVLQDNFSQGKGSLENTSLIDSTMEEIKNNEDKFIDYRDALTAGLSALNRPADDNRKPAVMLGTAHYAKGGEWDIVICPDMVYGNGGFPSSRSDEKSEEERRICYVAVTRAKKKLYLLSYIYDLQKNPVAQSPYLKEMEVQTVTIQAPQKDYYSSGYKRNW
jgi:DNA helicase-2/ATP-dependent DNA helicase PcrA